MSGNELITMSKNPTYGQKVYYAYSYLWKEASEIFWHQFVYDPIQDTFIKKGFESLVQYGHPEAAVNFHVNIGLHKLIHDIVGSKLAHGLEGFLMELAFHAGIKVAATAVFPLIYPLSITDNIPEVVKSHLIEPPLKFMGIHPLEIVNSIKVIPNHMLGSNNSISNYIDYFTLHKDHYHDRAEDLEYEQFMKSYNVYMESIDAFVHMFDDISVLYNNRYLPGITKKINLWFNIKMQMYLNSEAIDKDHDQKILCIREDINSCQNDYKTWNEILYNNLSYISLRAAWALFPSVFEYFFTLYWNNPVEEESNALVLFNSHSHTYENEGALTTSGSNTLMRAITPTESIRGLVKEGVRAVAPMLTQALGSTPISSPTSTDRKSTSSTNFKDSYRNSPGEHKQQGFQSLAPDRSSMNQGSNIGDDVVRPIAVTTQPFTLDEPNHTNSEPPSKLGSNSGAFKHVNPSKPASTSFEMRQEDSGSEVDTARQEDSASEADTARQEDSGSEADTYDGPLCGVYDMISDFIVPQRNRHGPGCTTPNHLALSQQNSPDRGKNTSPLEKSDGSYSSGSSTAASNIPNSPINGINFPRFKEDGSDSTTSIKLPALQASRLTTTESADEDLYLPLSGSRAVILSNFEGAADPTRTSLLSFMKGESADPQGSAFTTSETAAEDLDLPPVGESS